MARASKRKATGVDNVANEHLVASSGVLSSCWARIFTHVATHLQLPEQWRVSVLFLLYKNKGEKDDPDNYRGISLLCSAYKTFTKLLLGRLETRLVDQLSPGQFGFRRGRSTLDAIRIVVDRLQEERAKKKKAGEKGFYALFVDFKKAFDSISRRLLVDKLRNQFGLEENYVNLVRCLLLNNTLRFKQDRCQCGNFHGSRTEVVQSRGVLQGDSLSPFLFILYINDVVKAVESASKAQVLLYADDMIILSENRTELRKAIGELARWSQENHLEVNTAKTKVMKFRGGGRICDDDVFYMNGDLLEITNEYTYLGVTLQTALGFNKQVKRTKAKAMAVIGKMTRTSTAKATDSMMSLGNDICQIWKPKEGTHPEINDISWNEERWKGPGQGRHYVAGYAVTGFHSYICAKKGPHGSGGKDCRCRHCGHAFQMSHIDECSNLAGKPLYDRYEQLRKEVMSTSTT
ncbi:hypothetical protein TYRP_017147 [Tyrophagus putrescentiae]|nr:hypothetical protein TYRP_017147 [Tyrophagus putrescentiae]